VFHRPSAQKDRCRHSGEQACSKTHVLVGLSALGDGTWWCLKAMLCIQTACRQTKPSKATQSVAEQSIAKQRTSKQSTATQTKAQHGKAKNKKT